jgi:divalent metal cation (Fe/Co/Zn/Cd) transporter
MEPVSQQCGIDERLLRPSRSIVVIQWITIAWMLIECAAAMLSAARAGSVPMTAFGADSLVELLSAVVVLLQFGRRVRVRPFVAARIASCLLFLLTAVVVILAVLAARWRIAPERTYLGIGITLGALVIMPMLAAWKRRHAAATGDRALAADAVQSATCAYLAAITLASVLLQAVRPIWWVDSVAVACLVPLLLIEARRAWQGQACGCC